MATVFYRRSGGRFAEIERTQIKKKLHRANESLNFPQCWFSNRDNVIFPIQRKIVRKKIKKEKNTIAASSKTIFYQGQGQTYQFFRQ